MKVVDTVYTLDFVRDIETQTSDLVTNIKNFVVDTALNTYNGLVDAIGATPTNIFLMGLGIFLLCYVLLKIINR